MNIAFFITLAVFSGLLTLSTLGQLLYVESLRLRSREYDCLEYFKEHLEDRLGLKIDAIGPDADVARDAAPLRARHGRAAEGLLEAGLVHLQQPRQPRRVQERRRERGLAVPWAGVLAEVAAEHPVADAGAQLARDGAAVLDGEVRDAAPRIELVGGGKGPRGADVEAGGALAAMVALGVVERHIGGQQQFTEE